MDGAIEAGRTGLPASDRVWDQVVCEIVAAGRRLDERGWVPATAGNLSCRLPDGRIAITRSGVHKGHLSSRDVIAVDLDGHPACPDDRPSAETLLHCRIYRDVMPGGAVLHGHSIAATVLSMAGSDPVIRLSGYELLKAFAGQATHEAALELPVFDNDQDIRRLADTVSPLLPSCRLGYLLRGHGVYVWGPDIETALVRLEALEFLLACTLERRKLEARP